MPAESGYDTLEEAARAGLNAGYEIDPSIEHAGIIYEHGGRYFISEPQASGSNHQFKIKASKPKSATLAGVYHTHPDGERSDQFSAPDIQVARQLKVPSFIRHGEGSINVYRHGESKVKRDPAARGAGRRDAYFSPGAPVTFPELEAAQDADLLIGAGGQ